MGCQKDIAAKIIEKQADYILGLKANQPSLHDDVAFNEDNCRIRKDNSGENFAVVRHIAPNLLKQDNSKLSMKAKRHKCAYSDNFLYKILFQQIGT